MYSWDAPLPGSTPISFSSPQYGQVTVALVSAVPSPKGKSSIGSSPFPRIKRRCNRVATVAHRMHPAIRVVAEDLQSASWIAWENSEVAMEQLSFTDSNGINWVVREDGAENARSLSGDVAPGATWLRFDSDLEVRRLWHYPDDWRGLSPIQLETLLERASTVIARFRSTPRASAAADDGHRPDAMPSGFRSATTMPEPGPGARSRPERDDR